jgi:PAS domain S-box-containing protein
LTERRRSVVPGAPSPLCSAGCLDVLFQYTLGPLVLLDPDFNFIRVNQAYATATGRRVEEFPGHNHFEFFPSDAQTIFEEVVRSKQPFSVKARPFTYADHPEWGVTYWDWNLAPVLDAQGRVEALVFSLEDVTSKVTGSGPRKRPSPWRLLERLSLERSVSRRTRGIAAFGGVALEVILFYGLSFLQSPRQVLGIPGPAATLIGIVAGLVAGPIVAGLVALVGGVAYIVFLTDLGTSVAWPTIVISIVLWTAASVLAALAADRVRARAAVRETLLSQAVEDRNALVESLRASEEQQRLLADENSRLYQQQLAIAETVQFSLLNIPSERGPLRVSHLYRSATEAARVGGDFYDVFPLRDDSMAILIGDVSGHGIQAARTATLVRDVVQAFAHQSLAPDAVLALVNALLIDKALPGFVTAFFGLLHPRTGELLHASAGHPLPFLRRASGSVETLGRGSLPVGVLPDAKWETDEAALQVGDTLLLYTDGVIEARSGLEPFGESRLESLVLRKDVSVSHLPRLILDEVLAFTGGNLIDDVALLALQLTEEPAGQR